MGGNQIGTEGASGETTTITDNASFTDVAGGGQGGKSWNSTSQDAGGDGDSCTATANAGGLGASRYYAQQWFYAGGR